MKGIHCHFCKRSTFGPHICIMQASLPLFSVNFFSSSEGVEKSCYNFSLDPASGKMAKRDFSVRDTFHWMIGGGGGGWKTIGIHWVVGVMQVMVVMAMIVMIWCWNNFLAVTMRGQVELWFWAFKGGTYGKISQIRKYPRPTINNPCQDRMDGIGGQRGQVDSAPPHP